MALRADRRSSTMRVAWGSKQGGIKVIDEERPARQRELSGDPIANPDPAPRPERVAHEGRFARLEPLDVGAHGDALWEVAGDSGADSSWDYLPYGPWSAKEEYLAWLAKQQASVDPLFFAIIDQTSDRAVGVGTFMRITPEARCIEIGHLWFSPRLQKTPTATYAIFLLLRHAFDDLGYRRMEWKCHAMNAASRRAARRFGFTFEGIFYQNVIVKGKNRDTAWYSILDGEWPAIRANFETWLAPENFDENGNQRAALADMNVTRR
jgi:RimJ/RimL family protein N-acetyltransferase